MGDGAVESLRDHVLVLLEAGLTPDQIREIVENAIAHDAEQMNRWIMDTTT